MPPAFVSGLVLAVCLCMESDLIPLGIFVETVKYLRSSVRAFLESLIDRMLKPCHTN